MARFRRTAPPTRPEATTARAGLPEPSVTACSVSRRPSRRRPRRRTARMSAPRRRPCRGWGTGWGVTGVSRSATGRRRVQPHGRRAAGRTRGGRPPPGVTARRSVSWLVAPEDRRSAARPGPRLHRRGWTWCRRHGADGGHTRHGPASLPEGSHRPTTTQPSPSHRLPGRPTQIVCHVVSRRRNSTDGIRTAPDHPLRVLRSRVYSRPSSTGRTADLPPDPDARDDRAQFRCRT